MTYSSTPEGAVPLAQESLTAVFEMGTGVTSPLLITRLTVFHTLRVALFLWGV